MNLPFVIFGGEKRYLATHPTPDLHPMRAAPPWSVATGISIIDRSEWPSIVFEQRHVQVPILDQNGQGSCTAYAHTTAAMLIRERSGAPFVALSPNFLYTEINGGYDGGSNAGDAVQAMGHVGIAPVNLVPGRPLGPPGVNAQARQAALRFRVSLENVAQITSFEEAVTAVAMRWQLTFDVAAGQGYDVDSDGRVRYLGSGTNHEQTAGEGLRLTPNGLSMEILGRNSWTRQWGDGGFGWFQESHFAASNTIFALKYMIEDPEDAGLPPIIV